MLVASPKLEFFGTDSLREIHPWASGYCGESMLHPLLYNGAKTHSIAFMVNCERTRHSFCGKLSHPQVPIQIKTTEPISQQHIVLFSIVSTVASSIVYLEHSASFMLLRRRSDSGNHFFSFPNVGVVSPQN